MMLAGLPEQSLPWRVPQTLVELMAFSARPKVERHEQGHDDRDHHPLLQVRCHSSLLSSRRNALATKCKPRATKSKTHGSHDSSADGLLTPGMMTAAPRRAMASAFSVFADSLVYSFRRFAASLSSARLTRAKPPRSTARTVGRTRRRPAPNEPVGSARARSPPTVVASSRSPRAQCQRGLINHLVA